MALVKNLEHFSRRGVPLLDWFPIRQNPSFLFMVHPILLKCSLVKAMEHYNRRIASTLANGYNKQCDQNGRILKVPLVTNEWRLFGQLWKSITSNLKFWAIFGQVWATFYFKIWSHWQKFLWKFLFKDLQDAVKTERVKSLDWMERHNQEKDNRRLLQAGRRRSG